jgi:anti-anti-sigma factor
MNGEAVETGPSISALEYDRGDRCAIVSLSGQADIGDCEWVRALLEFQAVHGRGRLVVDLTRLASMDWWVAIILLWVGRVVSRRGGALVLASPQPGVAQTLHAVGASKVVTICDSVQHACASLPAYPPASA